MSSIQGVGEDTVDLALVAGALRRGIVRIVAGGVLGIAAGFGVAQLLPPSFEAESTVLIRDANGGSSPLAQLAGISDLVPGLGGAGSSLETELEIMTSRAVLEHVVDSLGLQVQVRAPRGRAPRELFTRIELPAELTPGGYRFERAGDVYLVEGPGGASEARPGTPYVVSGGELTLRGDGLPESFEIFVVDREAAVDEVAEKLSADPASGDVVEIVFRAPDRLTAAEVPNLMVEKYLERRRTVDRGTNQHRYEFLTAHIDSIDRQLTAAEAALRAEQERTGMLDPELSGRVEVERAMALQADLERVDVEARALQGVVAQRGARSGSPRELAAYPTLFQNPAINGLLAQLFTLETERALLLQRRTAEDQEVIALTEGIRNLENQLVTLSRDYLSGLSEQRAVLQGELQNYRGVLATLPEQSMQNLRRQREVRRLSETLVVLQAQLESARLGAIGEGGDVRQIDDARPPKRAAFPSLPIFLVIGLVGGLTAGTASAIAAEFLGSKVRTAQHAELATGRPALMLRPGAPLLLGGLEETRSLLILPVGKGARAGAIAQSLARTAAIRGIKVALVDLERAVAHLPRPTSLTALPAPAPADSQAVAPATLRESEDEAVSVVRAATGEALDPGEVRATVLRLEERLLTVILAVPTVDSVLTMALLSPDRPVVLAARAGSVRRLELREMVETLGRAGIDVAGIILHNGEDSGDSGA